MSMNVVHKVLEKLGDIFGYDRKRRADSDNIFNRSKKIRRVGYDQEDEYSDTDMEDIFRTKSINKRRTLSQKQLSGRQNHLTNGFSASTSASHRTNSSLPDDDVVFISDQPPCTSTIFVTRLKPVEVANPVAHSSLRPEVPPLMSLPRTYASVAASSSKLPSTSRYKFTPAVTNHVKPVPKAIPISTFNGFNGSRNKLSMSTSLMKQTNGEASGFKGINTVDQMSRGQRIANMGRSKSPPKLFSTSVMSVIRERDDKQKYHALLKQMCPDIYSRSIVNHTVDLTLDEPKGSSTKLVDLTIDEDKESSSKTTRSGSPTDQVNTLFERLSTKPVFDETLVSKFHERNEQVTQRVKSKIEWEQKNLNKLQNETDEAYRGFRQRYQGVTADVDKIIQRLEEGKDEEEEEEEVQYPVLTKEQQNTIRYALYDGPPHEVIINKFNLQITRNDLNTLVGTVWLNDAVINFYMNLIMERSEHRSDLPKAYCFNTFFSPTLISRGYQGVRRWTRKVDIFSYDILPVPIHVGGIHWCMAVIRMKDKIIRYYDSMGNSNQPVLDALERYIIDEAMDKKKMSLDTRDWKKESIRDCPQQRNGSDCGVFSCMNAEHLTRNAPLSFSQNEMPYFRQKMILEIATGNLIT